jgi:hypothetical protein
MRLGQHQYIAEGRRGGAQRHCEASFFVYFAHRGIVGQFVGIDMATRGQPHA